MIQGIIQDRSSSAGRRNVVSATQNDLNGRGQRARAAACPARAAIGQPSVFRRPSRGPQFESFVRDPKYFL
jgi:hypothetical protein